MSVSQHFNLVYFTLLLMTRSDMYLKNKNMMCLALDALINNSYIIIDAEINNFNESHFRQNLELVTNEFRRI